MWSWGCQWHNGLTIRSGQGGSQPQVKLLVVAIAQGGPVMPSIELECPVVGCTLGDAGEDSFMDIVLSVTVIRMVTLVVMVTILEMLTVL